MRYAAIAASLLALTGCEGPGEKAGEGQDQAAANAAGIKYTGDGPAERVGEAQDRANEAGAESIDARKDAIETEADTAADKLEEQAQKLRDDAKARTDVVTNGATAR